MKEEVYVEGKLGTSRECLLAPQKSELHINNWTRLHTDTRDSQCTMYAAVPTRVH